MHVQHAFGRIHVGPWPAAWVDRLNPLIAIAAATFLGMGLMALTLQTTRLILVMALMVLIEAAVTGIVIYLNLRQAPADDDAPAAAQAARESTAVVRWWPFELALLGLCLLMMTAAGSA